MKRTALLAWVLAVGCGEPVCPRGYAYSRELTQCVCESPGASPEDGCQPVDAGDAGPRDAGPGDAGRDAGPDAPSAPEVAIEPEAPRTLDDLSVRIVAASVDPRDRELHYEYTWRRDTTVVDEHTASISHELTRAGEVWRVEVVAVSDDGRRSLPGIAMVTIANTAPELSTVGLRTYRPIAGDALRAFVGLSRDIDGHGTSIEYVWRVGEREIVGRGSTLTLTPDIAVAGDHVVVRARARDAQGASEWVEAGPAIVVPDVTRWRPILPNRRFEGAHAVGYDANHRRVIMHAVIGNHSIGPVETWEMAIDRGVDGFTRLLPSGEGPIVESACVAVDEDHHRMIVFGGRIEAGPGAGGHDTVFALELAQRGNERWTRLEPAGDTPEWRMLSMCTYDRTSQRLWIWGGFGEAPTSELWSLDLSVPGAESWTKHWEAPERIVSGVIVADSRRRRLLWVGGTIGAGGSDFGTATDRIYALDIDNPSLGFVEQSSRLPAPVMAPLAAVDETRDRLLVSHGTSSIVGPSATDSYEIDLETLAVRSGSPTGAPSDASGGWMTYDPLEDRFIAWAPESAFAGHMDLRVFAIDGESLAWSTLFVHGETAPRGVYGAARAWTATLEVVLGGTDERSAMNDSAWSLAVTAGVDFTPRALLADVVTARAPQSFGAETLGDSAATFHVLDAERGAWSLASPRWVEHNLRDGAAPLTRSEGLVFDGCGRVVVAGGDLQGTDRLRCIALDGLRDCAWEHLSDAPPARSNVGVATFAQRRVLVTLESSALRVRTMDCHAGGDQWIDAEVDDGDHPTPRTGAAMTQPRSGPLSSTSVLFFGGSGAPDRADVWELQVLGSDRVRWREIEVGNDAADPGPFGRRQALLIPLQSILTQEPTRVLLYAGRRGQTVLSDVWELRLR